MVNAVEESDSAQAAQSQAHGFVLTQWQVERKLCMKRDRQILRVPLQQEHLQAGKTRQQRPTTSSSPFLWLWACHGPLPLPLALHRTVEAHMACSSRLEQILQENISHGPAAGERVLHEREPRPCSEGPACSGNPRAHLQPVSTRKHRPGAPREESNLEHPGLGRWH